MTARFVSSSLTLVALVVTASFAAFPANAANLDFAFDTAMETKILSDSLTPGSTVSLSGLFGPGSVKNTVTFDWGTASPFSLSAGWRVGASGASTPRMVGVNIDILDSTNSIVGSDLFTGLTSEVANSTMQIANLVAGKYTLVLTGTAVRDGIFDVEIAADALLPPPPAPAIATPETDLFGYDTLVGTKQIGDPFASGSEFRIDGAISEIGALLNETAFRVTGGTLSASVRWAVGASGGTDPRLVGVNVDLINAANFVVATDVFGGVAGGQATSTLVATGLTPGDYLLRMTGNSVRGGQYEIALGTSATPPVLPPIDSVPEPTTWALMLFGFGAIGGAMRRQRPKARFAF